MLKTKIKFFTCQDYKNLPESETGNFGKADMLKSTLMLNLEINLCGIF